MSDWEEGSLIDAEQRYIIELESQNARLRDLVDTDLQEKLEIIANIALQGVLADGAHHKDWYLENIINECGFDVSEWREKYGWTEGVAP